MAARRPRDVRAPAEWAEIYKRQPGLILAFHGCDRKTGDAVLQGTEVLEESQNEYDWLGSGVYFWEADPWRALDFAKEAMSKGYMTKRPITDPYVVGAVIDLGICCNLLEIEAINELGKAYDELKEALDLARQSLPTNKGARRNLDRAVVEYMHHSRERGMLVGRKLVKLPPYDTVRAAFPEGEELYEDAGFRRKNHIQIAVREPKCIKGYFRLPGL